MQGGSGQAVGMQRKVEILGVPIRSTKNWEREKVPSKKGKWKVSKHCDQGTWLVFLNSNIFLSVRA